MSGKLELNSFESFKRLYFVAVGLGCTAFTLVAVWMGIYSTGYGFGASEPVFHWHPTLMNFGLMFLNGQAIMIYRGFRYTQKAYTKFAHGAMQFCAVASIVLGITATWKYHDFAGIVHLHSIHSWIGISAASLFLCNWLLGFAVFAMGWASPNVRQKVLTFHRMLGVGIFMLSLCAVLMGLNERAIFSFTCWMQKMQFCQEMILANIFGVLVAAYAVCVLICVVYPAWIRQSMPNEN